MFNLDLQVSQASNLFLEHKASNFKFVWIQKHQMYLLRRFKISFLFFLFELTKSDPFQITSFSCIFQYLMFSNLFCLRFSSFSFCFLFLVRKIFFQISKPSKSDLFSDFQTLEHNSLQILIQFMFFYFSKAIFFNFQASNSELFRFSDWNSFVQIWV